VIVSSKTFPDLGNSIASLFNNRKLIAFFNCLLEPEVYTSRNPQIFFRKIRFSSELLLYFPPVSPSLQDQQSYQSERFWQPYFPNRSHTGQSIFMAKIVEDDYSNIIKIWILHFCKS
jgi:hypothetical protein